MRKTVDTIPGPYSSFGRKRAPRAYKGLGTRLRVGKPTGAHSHSHNDAPSLTSRSSGMPSKKTMKSLEDVCSCRNYSKARPRVSR